MLIRRTCVLALLPVSLLACSAKTTERGKASNEAVRPIAAAAPTAAAMGIPAAASDAGLNLKGDLVFSGDLRPSATADLGFKVGGALTQRRVSRGDHVTAGQVLAVLSDAEAQAQLAQAQAAVAAARAGAAIAEDGAQRVDTLHAQAAAPGNLAITSRLGAEAARAQVAQAEAAVLLARAMVANHILKAPFNGVITRGPDGTGMTVPPGHPVFRLEKLDPLTLQATIAEADLDRLHLDDQVKIEAGGHRGTATVTAIVRSLDPMSRRAPVELTVANADGLFIAGSYVRATLNQADPTKAPMAGKQEATPNQEGQVVPQ